jgi:hypothetical protein
LKTLFFKGFFMPYVLISFVGFIVVVAETDSFKAR